MLSPTSAAAADNAAPPASQRRVAFQPQARQQRPWNVPPEAQRAANFIPAGGLQLGDWTLVDRALDSPTTDPSDNPTVPGAIFSPPSGGGTLAEEDNNLDQPLDNASRTTLILPPGDSLDALLEGEEEEEDRRGPMLI